MGRTREIELNDNKKLGTAKCCVVARGCLTAHKTGTGANRDLGQCASEINPNRQGLNHITSVVIAEGATLKCGAGETAGTKILTSKPTVQRRLRRHELITTTTTTAPLHSTAQRHHRRIGTIKATTVNHGGPDLFWSRGGVQLLQV